jgi:hypothetical protein
MKLITSGISVSEQTNKYLTSFGVKLRRQCSLVFSFSSLSSQGMFQQQGFKSQNAPAKLVANEVVTTLADAVVQLSQARAHPRR